MSLRRVYLHGPLAETFGPGPFEFSADNATELLAGMRVHCPGFRKELTKFSSLTIVKVGPNGELESVSEEELPYGFGLAKELHLNVNVTAAGAETFALAVAAYGSAAYYAAYALYSLAMMYFMSQVIQGLQDTITTEDTKPDNKSALFDGPENRSRQGARVQLNYGRCRIGSVTLNQQMTSVRQALVKSDNLALDVSTSVSYNIYSNDIFSISPVVSSFTVNGVTTAAGGTYVLAGVANISVAANGATSITSLGALSNFDINVAATDTGVSPAQVIDQVITVSVVEPELTWQNSGGGGPGGGDGADGGGGGGPGGGDSGGQL